jgi:hypothetical protein
VPHALNVLKELPALTNIRGFVQVCIVNECSFINLCIEFISGPGRPDLDFARFNGYTSADGDSNASGDGGDDSGDH